MRFKLISKEKISRLPKTPGVYIFKRGIEFLYIGKTTNLQERVKNHFPSRSEEERRTNVLRTQQPSYRDNLFINKVKKIGYIKTGSEIEALILEANLIKKYQPQYNILWRDDKNYFFVVKTKEDFPRIFWTHQPKENVVYVGPFVDGKALKETLKILRKVFPYRSCKTLPKKPCLWYQLGRCPAPCLLKSKVAEQLSKFKSQMKTKCQGNTKKILKILQGKKAQVLKNLKKEMKRAARSQSFERAALRRDQITSLEKVLAHARLSTPDGLVYGGQARVFQQIFAPKEISWPKVQKMLQRIMGTKTKISRIEAYDISNIQGQQATGSMVTFVKGNPDKNFYRRFKIKMEGKPNDVAMIKEVLSRRFKHPEWPLPDLILIDGGKAQLNTTINFLNQRKSVKSASISVSALAKRGNKLYLRNRKKPILLKSLPREIFNLTLQLSSEAHRFALKYHRKLRKKALTP